MIDCKLGIGPMSLNCINAVVEYSNQHEVSLMLIASRRQIECKDFGPGYVANMTTNDFAHYVKKIDAKGTVFLCRDHGGPYQGYKEEGLHPDDALQRSLHSFREDVEAGFDLIHVDCCFHRGDIREATSQILNEINAFANAKNRKIFFEVGTEENVGVSSDPNKFRQELEFIQNIVQPTFVVGQSGSLIKEIFQIGHFDYPAVQHLTEIAHHQNVLFKEHNADYLDTIALNMRKAAGVDAINIAPEFGVLETRFVTTTANLLGLQTELNNFRKVVLEQRRYEKWLYGKADDDLKVMMSGHYSFTSDEYNELFNRLKEIYPLEQELNEHFFRLINHYLKGIQ